MQKQKGFANVTLVIIIVLIAGGVGYYLAKQVKKPPVPPLSPTVACQQANWSALLPQIKNILIAAGAPSVGQFVPLAVGEEVDITGDGCTEAVVLVDAGGAYTTTFALFRSENSSPVFAEQKENSGQIVKVMFDAGASVKNQLGYKTLPQDNGFYTFQKNYDEQNGQIILANCEINTYVWNSATKVFDYNANLTTALSLQVCI